MKPLDDLRIVAIDSWMAVPSAAAILADLGADVIKVEPLSGDPMRNNSRAPKIDDGPAKDYDYQFDVDNRGKKSIAVDLGSEQGTALVHKLCENADVFMCNLLKHRQDRFNVDPESLKAVNPKIVHATLTGYGTTGPEASRPGYDVTAFFGRSGLSHIMQDGPDGAPPSSGTAQGDHTTGLALVGAILAGLRLAERSGQAQVVESSLYQAAVWTQATAFSVTAQDGAPFRPRAREQSISPTMNRYRCGDGRWIVVNMPRMSDWSKVCPAVGCADLLEDERFSDFRGRFRNMAEITARFDAEFEKRSRDEWGDIFDDAGIIWGPVMGLDEVVADPQAEALNMFPEIDSGSFGLYKTVANPLRIDGVDTDPTTPAPALGADTRAVLAEAGYSDSEIDALVDAGVVASAI